LLSSRTIGDVTSMSKVGLVEISPGVDGALSVSVCYVRGVSSLSFICWMNLLADAWMVLVLKILLKFRTGRNCMNVSFFVGCSCISELSFVSLVSRALIESLLNFVGLSGIGCLFLVGQK